MHWRQAGEGEVGGMEACRRCGLAAAAHVDEAAHVGAHRAEGVLLLVVVAVQSHLCWEADPIKGRP